MTFDSFRPVRAVRHFLFAIGARTAAALPFVIPFAVPAAAAGTGAPVPAFPGALGHGAESVGGRGGRVLYVTSLADGGPGSLRAALEAEGPRTVLFRVAGVIELRDRIRIDHPYLTVAGQTAPGSGIVVRGADNSLLLLRRDAHDVILRYLRLRNGSGVADGNGHDNLSINSGYNVIVDHLSLSWSTDENVSLYRQSEAGPIHHISIQRSLIAEGLDGHSNGLLVGGRGLSNDDPPIDNWRKIRDLSIHYNLFAHNSHRNPRITAGPTRVINNVVYNWKARVGSTTRGASVDWINNLFKAGPMVRNDRLLLHENFNPDDVLERYPDPSLYPSGNIALGAGGRPLAVGAFYRLGFIFAPMPSRYLRREPLPAARVAVPVLPPAAAYVSVLDDVGANARLDCDGRWRPAQDATDRRLLAEVRAGSGPRRPVARAAAAAYRGAVAGQPCRDSDLDGMPDRWERANGFDPDDPGDGAADGDGDGYSNLEAFLNGTGRSLDGTAG